MSHVVPGGVLVVHKPFIVKEPDTLQIWDKHNDVYKEVKLSPDILKRINKDDSFNVTENGAVVVAFTRKGKKCNHSFEVYLSLI